MATATQIKTDLGRLDIRVTGQRPENEPYIWFGNTETGLVVDLLNESAMRALKRQIDRALNA